MASGAYTLAIYFRLYGRRLSATGDHLEGTARRIVFVRLRGYTATRPGH